jgi:hypothetical protein
MARPTSDSLSAGASLVPSPVVGSSIAHARTRPGKHVSARCGGLRFVSF